VRLDSNVVCIFFCGIVVVTVLFFHPAKTAHSFQSFSWILLFPPLSSFSDRIEVPQMLMVEGQLKKREKEKSQSRGFGPGPNSAAVLFEATLDGIGWGS
jgi:hypothetical protein